MIRRIEYDPNRATRIALVDYPDGIKPRYILAGGARAGDVVSSSGGRPTNTDDDSVSSVSIDIRPGNAMPLSEMPIGTIGTMSNWSGRGRRFRPLRRCLGHAG